MGNFFAELKRRHIYRVAAAYAVVAWVLIQLVNNVAPALRLPEWAPTLVIVLLLVGFPITLLIAWMRELAPVDGTAAHATTAKLDFVLIGALVAVLAAVSYQQLAPAPRTAVSQQPGVVAARTASATQAGAISVAVLPFENLSGDAGQEFFSDGITEEITAALAKIPDLRVVARTSAFQFKAQNRDIQSIGQQLHASHFIEGSVRKAGNRVRITAQLIEADNGVHVWAENYDRELTDVFAIQEEIATAIAGALRMPLGLKQGERLVSNRGIDQESHQQYLRARVLYRARGLKNLNDAISLLDQAVARNPDYAPAWALLAYAHSNIPNYSGLGTISVEEARRLVNSTREKAEPAARKAIELDPNLADGYSALGVIQERDGKFSLAEELFFKALALDPNLPEALNSYGQMLSYLGRVKESVAMLQQLQALEPFVPIFNRNTAITLWLDGQDDAALPRLGAVSGANNFMIALIHAAAGRYKEAADTLLSAASGDYPPEALQEAVRLLGMAPAPVSSPQNVKRLRQTLGPGLDWVYLFVGAPSQFLQYYEDNVKAGWMATFATPLLWHPSVAAARKTERFKALVRTNGLIEYWRAKGWPKFCHPTTGDDFACE